MPPKDIGRRAFLQSLGASTALAALAQFFQLETATKIIAAPGPIVKKDLKSIHSNHLRDADHHGETETFLSGKQGLNVEVIKTAVWGGN